MNELKLCPFCGGDAELSSGKFDGKETSYVVCKRCGSQGEFFFVSPRYASAIRAIEAWNRRAGDAPTVEPERKKGKWLRSGSEIFPYECDQCGETNERITPWCPHCGAAMKEGDQDD